MKMLMRYLSFELTHLLFWGGKDIHFTSATITTSGVSDLHHEPYSPSYTHVLKLFKRGLVSEWVLQRSSNCVYMVCLFHIGQGNVMCTDSHLYSPHLYTIEAWLMSRRLCMFQGERVTATLYKEADLCLSAKCIDCMDLCCVYVMLMC